MNNLLGILSEGNPRGGLGAADDPYLQMLRSQGGLGALFGGAGGRGSFGDYATSQEGELSFSRALSFSCSRLDDLTLNCLLRLAAFDRIVTQLAQAAGPSADRPPPATSSMIHSLPTIPIDSILLCELTSSPLTPPLLQADPLLVVFFLQLDSTRKNARSVRLSLCSLSSPQTSS